MIRSAFNPVSSEFATRTQFGANGEIQSGLTAAFSHSSANNVPMASDQSPAPDNSLSSSPSVL